MTRWLSVLLMLVATPVVSLSCRPPNVAQAFQEAQDDPADWLIVSGQFQPLGSAKTALPKGQSGTVDLRLKGASLTRGGFTAPFQQQVTVEISCTGQWCGSVAMATNYTVFLRRSADGYRTFTGPCPRHVFFDEESRMESILTACLNGNCPSR